MSAAFISVLLLPMSTQQIPLRIMLPYGNSVLL
jgi:hypothetical protein